MLKLPSYILKSRHGIYYLRLNRNGKDVRRSLRTKDEKVAMAAAFAFGNQLMNNGRNISNLEIITKDIHIKTNGTKEDNDSLIEALKLLALATPPGTTPLPNLGGNNLPQISSYTLQDCVEAYISDREHEISANSKATYATSFKRLINGFGSDSNIQSITAEIFVAWRKDNLDLNYHPNSQNRDLNAFHSFFEWCISRQRYWGSNPIIKPNFSKKIKSELIKKFAEPIEPFTKNDLDLIFNNISNSKKPCAFWMPLIALYTGMRISEIAELKIENIINESNEFFIKIIDGKTESAVRTVPLHNDITSIGLSDYLDDVQRLYPNTEYLFPHLLSATKNGRANQPGKDFSKLKTHQLRLGKDKVFHSFRSTLISCLQKNGMPSEQRKIIVGHEIDNSKAHDDVHIKNYSKAKYEMHELAELLFKYLNYKKAIGFTLPKLVYREGMFDEKFNSIQKLRKNSALRKKRAQSRARKTN